MQKQKKQKDTITITITKVFDKRSLILNTGFKHSYMQPGHYRADRMSYPTLMSCGTMAVWVAVKLTLTIFVAPFFLLLLRVVPPPPPPLLPVCMPRFSFSTWLLCRGTRGGTPSLPVLRRSYASSSANPVPPSTLDGVGGLDRNTNPPFFNIFRRNLSTFFTCVSRSQALFKSEETGRRRAMQGGGTNNVSACTKKKTPPQHKETSSTKHQRNNQHHQH